jgi:hypothetical protein
MFLARHDALAFDRKARRNDGAARTRGAARQWRSRPAGAERPQDQNPRRSVPDATQLPGSDASSDMLGVEAILETVSPHSTLRSETQLQTPEQIRPRRDGIETGLAILHRSPSHLDV